MRNDGRPWGGLQLLLSGDFLQLPPIVRKQQNAVSKVRFCFESICFKRSFPNATKRIEEMKCMENINGKTRLYVLLLHCKGNKTKKKELERKIKQENLRHQQYSEQNENDRQEIRTNGNRIHNTHVQIQDML